MILFIVWTIFLFRNSPATAEGKSFSNHTNYVTTVISTKPTKAFPGGLIVTGSNDRLIRAFKEEQTEPIFILHGHQDAGLSECLFLIPFLKFALLTQVMTV